MKPGPHWEYFYKDGSSYLNDKSHKAAWCKACFDLRLNSIVRAEQEAQLVNPTLTMRAEESMRKQVFNEMQPICGKVDVLLAHLIKCRNITDVKVKQWAANANEVKKVKHKELNMNIPTAPIFADRSGQSSSALTQPVVPVQVAYTPSLSCPPPPYISAPIETSASLQHSADISLSTAASSSRAGSEYSPSPVVTPLSASPSSNVLVAHSALAANHKSPPAWSKEQQEEFDRDLCNVLVSRNWAWSSVHDPVFRDFLKKYIPGCHIPSPEHLSGAVLNKHAAEVEEMMKQTLRGKFATGQCDGWKDVTRASLVASLVTVEGKPYLVHTHNVSDKPKTADTLLDIMLHDIYYCVVVLGLCYIALCSDAGGDAASMRRKAARQLPWLIVLDCWAHQINLVVGDYFKLKLPRMSYVDKATEVIKWFNNHSYALGLLRKQQLLSSGGSEPLVLFLPVLTRWTSHFLAIRRLLLLKPYLQACVAIHHDGLVKCAGTKNGAKTRAESILAYIQNPVFWAELEKVSCDLQPLAVAANVTQSASARLDQVLITLARLHWIYSQPPYDASVRGGIHRSLALRWRKNADRDVFILAVFLNPYYRNKLFNRYNPALMPAALYSMVVRVAQRILKLPEISADFDSAFWDYIEDRGEYSTEKMSLDRHQSMAVKQKTSVDICRIWRSILSPDDKFGELALRLLSIVPNSASAERVFSQMGLVHTRIRNRLHFEKVHKSVMVRMNLRRNYGDLSEQRLKRNFDDLSKQLLDTHISDPAGVSTLSSAAADHSLATPLPPSMATHDNTADNVEVALELFLALDETLAAAVDALIEEATSSEAAVENPDVVEGASIPVVDTTAPPRVRSGSRVARPNAKSSRTIPASEQLEPCNIFDFEQLAQLTQMAWVGEHDKIEAESDLYSCMAMGAEVDLNDG